MRVARAYPPTHVARHGFLGAARVVACPSSARRPKPPRVSLLLACRCSLEEDFVTWSDNFWAATCDLLDIDPDSIDLTRCVQGACAWRA